MTVATILDAPLALERLCQRPHESGHDALTRLDGRGAVAFGRVLRDVHAVARIRTPEEMQGFEAPSRRITEGSNR